MKLYNCRVSVLLIFIYGVVYSNLFSQSDNSKPTRQSSLEAFSQGKYEQAYKEFSELLLVYPKDPLYKYYSGVCLVNLKRNAPKAVTLLRQALQGASVVKSLPPDALFYLGRAQQMSGEFSEAIDSYNSFTSLAGKKVAKEYKVAEMISQCTEKTGAVTPDREETKEEKKSNFPEANPSEKLPVVKDDISKPVKPVVVEKQPIPIEYDRMLDDALELQFKSDSVNNLIAELKSALESLSADQKLAMNKKIYENGLIAASFQKLADEKYNQAQSAMNPRQDKVSVEVPARKSSDLPATLQQQTAKAEKPVEKQDEIIGRIEPEVVKPVEVFSVFEILKEPLADPDAKIEINPDVPEGLIYRIQIAVFRNPVAPSYFRGITPVYGFSVAGSDKTNYYAGIFRRSSDAHKALAKVKAKGFSDAFVVSFSDKKAVSAERAAVLEKEWGAKPFIKLMSSVSNARVDTIPPTLSYRVEVIRSQKPVKDDILAGLRKIAGSRGLDIQTLNDGNFVYLIGKFITFESAAEYVDLLIRNGYREAKVVAWLGIKEIPVETARQLFDNL